MLLGAGWQYREAGGDWADGHVHWHCGGFRGPTPGKACVTLGATVALVFCRRVGSVAGEGGGRFQSLEIKNPITAFITVKCCLVSICSGSVRL